MCGAELPIEEAEGADGRCVGTIHQRGDLSNREDRASMEFAKHRSNLFVLREQLRPHQRHAARDIAELSSTSKAGVDGSHSICGDNKRRGKL
jgi:hypothetical protein